MNEKQFNWVLNKGLDCNQLFTLMFWDSNIPNIKLEGWKMLLVKKGYLDNKQITQAGEELLNEFLEQKEDAVITSFNFDVWCEQTVDSLINHLITFNFKKNLKGFGGVPFLPTKVELKNHLERFWKAGYKDYKDYDKIHKCLLEHIQECVKKNSFAPAIKYFIFKSGSHNTTFLAGSYDNYEENIEIKQEKIKRSELF